VQILERDVDRQFTKLLKKDGLTSIKLSTLGRYGTSGWPDRLVLAPGGIAVFVELKAPGKEPTDLQLDRIQQLNDLGFNAGWCDNAEEAIARVRGFIR
jgi:Holliday junction resolvase